MALIIPAQPSVFHKTASLALRGKRIAVTTAKRLSVPMVAMALLGGCVSTSASLSPEEVAARIERYHACPPAGIHMTTDIGQVPTTIDGRVSIGPITSHVIFPGSPGWLEADPIPAIILESSATWTSPPSQWRKHLALRSSLHRPVPKGTTQLTILEDSEHWTTSRISVVSTRDEEGQWRTDRVRMFNIGSPRPEHDIGASLLSPQNSARLDALLADPCLDAEPTNLVEPGEDYVVFPHFTLEIVQAGRRRTFAGPNPGTGRIGEIIYLTSNGAL